MKISMGLKNSVSNKTHLIEMQRARIGTHHTEKTKLKMREAHVYRDKSSYKKAGKTLQRRYRLGLLIPPNKGKSWSIQKREKFNRTILERKMKNA